MTAILADLFRTADPDELKDIVYLSQGKVHPDFFPQKIGMADKLILDAIGKSDEEVRKAEELWVKIGDIGIVAERIKTRPVQGTLFQFGSEKPEMGTVTVKEVMSALYKIEETAGKGSASKKNEPLKMLLKRMTPLEARFLCRMVNGKMRVGAGDMTILDALAEAFATKEDRPAIERAFNVTCDLGFVAETIAKGGMDAIDDVKVSVGNPVKVMLAERLPSVEEIVERMGGECAIEYKYDGIRVQAHIGKDTVKLYSRRLEDLTSNFPDIAEALRSRCRFGEAIIEGECVAVDPDTGYMLPFQNVTHRRKKHGIDDAVRDIPVRMFMFDILYKDGEDLTLRPYLDRRRALENGFEMGDSIQMTTMRIVRSEDEGREFFDNAVAARCEGVMAKSIADNSVYRAGNRGFLWIKYKKDYQESLTDSFDLAVVGAFYGMGKRAGKYGALLMASYDQENGRFATVCKLGTGFDDAFLDGMPDLLNGTLTKERPQIVDAEMVPDVWFEPHVVLEVVAAEITLSPIHTAAKGVYREDSGLGIRFPRFTGRVRDDKEAEQCTTVSEISEMYEMQTHDSDGLSE